MLAAIGLVHGDGALKPQSIKWVAGTTGRYRPGWPLIIGLEVETWAQQIAHEIGHKLDGEALE